MFRCVPHTLSPVINYQWYIFVNCSLRMDDNIMLLALWRQLSCLFFIHSFQSSLEPFFCFIPPPLSVWTHLMQPKLDTDDFIIFLIIWIIQLRLAQGCVCVDVLFLTAMAIQYKIVVVVNWLQCMRLTSLLELMLVFPTFFTKSRFVIISLYHWLHELFVIVLQVFIITLCIIWNNYTFLFYFIFFSNNVYTKLEA